MKRHSIIKCIGHIKQGSYRNLFDSINYSFSVCEQSDARSVVEEERSGLVPNKVSCVLHDEDIDRGSRVSPEIPNFHEGLVQRLVRELLCAHFNFSKGSWVHEDV